MWCHSQSGVTVKVVVVAKAVPQSRCQGGVKVKAVSQSRWLSLSRWCHSQCGAAVKVVSQSRWCHTQGGVTVKVFSQSRWCHSQGGVTLKVVSHSRWCHSQGGVTVNVVSQSMRCHRLCFTPRRCSPLCPTESMHVATWPLSRQH